MPLKSGNKTWSLTEVLAFHEHHAKANGTKNCEVRDWLRKNHKTATMVEFEDWLYSDADRGANTAWLGFQTAHKYEPDPVIAAELQDYYAERMVALPFEATRGLVETLLVAPENGGVVIAGGLAPEALAKLSAYVRANHPHAEAFFAQPLQYGLGPTSGL